MKTINLFIWKVFKQNTDAERKQVPLLTVNITELSDGAMGETGENNVYISAASIQEYFPPGQAQFWFASLLYHEITHIFQWSGQGTAPSGLTEGMADYVMVKSNYYDPNNYDKPGDGNSWDEGYGVTARFLEYCDSLRDGFTADLNNMMREVYKDEYFQDLLGISLDQVWSDYKAKYAT
ncbi:basic secretory protease [Phtheirospermum japonicum]|uniref:Basic secretory protease n=1 Tax=Phtheirospermum japonicum TaxID=374723 RepID=A0A830BRI1_9LAMI|nr:basic secretory protease [Phtheirospermum japonicum]